MDTFRCPLNGQKVRPAKCIHCKDYWGLWNQGVLCQRANRWLPYKYDWEREQLVLKR